MHWEMATGQIVKVVCRIQSLLCLALGIVFLIYLHWDTYWYAL